MFRSDKKTYLQETEIKPNMYATYALIFILFGNMFCWLLNEIGLFRVGDIEMRVGSAFSIVSAVIPLLIFLINRNAYANPKTKYCILIVSTFITLTVTTLLTFHTTIMLLFPIFMAMLYKSKRLGRVAFFSSVLCTIVSPILGYVLGTWDIELFKELILIGTNGTTEIINMSQGIRFESIIKILLYIVLPRLIMVGSCALLMFYTIRIGSENVNKQIMLDQLNDKDALTGLYNRNYLSEVMNNKEIKGSVGVIFFDVNGLKKINDTLGHDVGDLLLKRCSKTIIDTCTSDLYGAFRLGGDEFLVIASNINEKEIHEFLDRISYRLDKANSEEEIVQAGISCSMAWGYVIGDFSEIEALIKEADSNMYSNKKGIMAK